MLYLTTFLLFLLIKKLLEILEFEFNDDSKYIVIASDGVWEFLDNNRVTQLVNPFYNRNDPEGACNVLVKESIEWWERVIFFLISLLFFII